MANISVEGKLALQNQGMMEAEAEIERRGNAVSFFGELDIGGAKLRSKQSYGVVFTLTAKRAPLALSSSEIGTAVHR